MKTAAEYRQCDQGLTGSFGEPEPRDHKVRFKNSSVLLCRRAMPGMVLAVMFMSAAVADQGTALPQRTTHGVTDNGSAVAALGRIEPMAGIIRIGAPAPLASTTGLIIRELYVDEGDDVVAGQELAVTDMATVLGAVALEAEAQVSLARFLAAAAQSQAEERCTQADVREREAKRREDLFERNMVTAEESERVRAEAILAAATCRTARDQASAAEAGIGVAEAAHHRANAELERISIRAPFAGRVLEILARPGELVTTRGALELARVDRMLAIAEVYESDIRHVRVGQRARVSSPVLEDELTGSVHFIRQKVRRQDQTATDPGARKDARVVEVEILLDQPESVAGLTYLQVTVQIDP